MDMEPEMITTDGNNAVASVAYRTSEVIAIYPITPQPWQNTRQPGRARDIPPWGDVPKIVEMQSEGRRHRHRTRRPADRGAGDLVHLVAGAAADDPQPLQVGGSG